MVPASPEINELARRLLGFESPFDNSSADGVAATVQVIEELRARLVKLVGVHGFRSLLSRALALAKVKVPLLSKVQVGADGSLVGFDVVEQSHEEEEARQPGIVLVAHLLELLVTFIGAPLTLRLLRDKWPNASLDQAAMRTEDKP